MLYFFMISLRSGLTFDQLVKGKGIPPSGLIFPHSKLAPSFSISMASTTCLIVWADLSVSGIFPAEIRSSAYHRGAAVPTIVAPITNQGPKFHLESSTGIAAIEAQTAIDSPITRILSRHAHFQGVNVRCRVCLFHRTGEHQRLSTDCPLFQVAERYKLSFLEVPDGHQLR